MGRNGDKYSRFPVDEFLCSGFAVGIKKTPGALTPADRETLQ